MERNARSRVTVNSSLSVDPGRVTSGSGFTLYFCFTVMLEALSQDMRAECPQELLYADDLELVSE